MPVVIRVIHMTPAESLSPIIIIQYGNMIIDYTVFATHWFSTP